MGQTVTLTAEPADGYHFAGWVVVSGEVALDGDSFAMPAGDVTVRAVFEPHAYGAYEPNQDGTHTRVCAVCGERQTEACSGGTATCATLATCALCDQPYGELDPNSHEALTEHEAVAATHLEEGSAAYWHCEGCDRCFADAEATKEISPTDTVLGRLPEHSANGSGWHSDESGHWLLCACGERFELAEHEPEVVGAKDSTCTEDGYTGDTVCSVCGYVIAKGEVVPETGHDFEDGVCTACGAEETCSGEPEEPVRPEPAPSKPELEDSKPTVPETGDASALFSLPLALLGAIAAGASLALARRRS